MGSRGGVPGGGAPDMHTALPPVPTRTAANNFYPSKLRGTSSAVLVDLDC